MLAFSKSQPQRDIKMALVAARLNVETILVVTGWRTHAHGGGE